MTQQGSPQTARRPGLQGGQGTLLALPWRNDSGAERWLWVAGAIVLGILSVAAGDEYSIGRWFLAGGATFFALSQLPLSVLHWVRLGTGAAIAITGAILTLQLSYMLGRPEESGESQLLGLLLYALVLLAFASSCTENRLRTAQDAREGERARLATARHAEIMTALRGDRVPATQAQGSPSGWYALAALMLWHGIRSRRR